MPRRSGRLAHKPKVKLEKGVPACPGGHVLQRFVTGIEEWGCDRCAARQSAEAVMWGCRICDYDVCDSCMEGEAPKGTKRKIDGPPKASAYNIFMSEQMTEGKPFATGVAAWNALPECGRAKYYQIVRERLEEWARANGKVLPEEGDAPKPRASKQKCSVPSADDSATSNGNASEDANEA